MAKGLYKYYQLVGGEEPWTLIQDDQPLETISPTFVTVLSLDNEVTKTLTPEEKAAIKYQGPLYFDLDTQSEQPLSEAIADANEVVGKLEEDFGLTATDMEIYLSGKKGIHILVPDVVFRDKPAPIKRLPLIYKDMVLGEFLATNSTVDERVYTGKSGRMLRTCYNIRDNGNYRVPITREELRVLDEEMYQRLCKAKRAVPAIAPQYRPKLALRFEILAKKHAGYKVPKYVPVSGVQLAQHAITMRRVLDGVDLKGDTGFNRIAMQVALFARESKWTEAQMLEEARGLIANHVSDGSRYNTDYKRRRELSAQFDTMTSDLSYQYNFKAIKALLLPTVKVVAEDGSVSEVLADDHESEALAGGVREEGYTYVVSRGEQGDVTLTNFIIVNAHILIDPADGGILAYSVQLKGDGSIQPHKRIALATNALNGNLAFHAAVTPYGGTFRGNDLDARGIQQLMLRSAQKTYVVQTEGLNVLSVPNAEDSRLRDPFVVWTDTFGVQAPAWVAETNVKFEFQGAHDPAGVIKTDLTRAPMLGKWLAAEPGNKDALRDTLINLIDCQSPEMMARMLGWTVACFYRQLFHTAHRKFPILHVYGQAGAGKTEMTMLMQHFHMHKADGPVSTPSSTIFGLQNLVAGSASIPVILDEYKPHEMKNEVSKYRTLFREAYNRHESVRGGGNNKSGSFSALSRLKLSGPIAFIAEAVEGESAIAERMILVAVKRPNRMLSNASFQKFIAVNKEHLSILGLYLAGQVAKGTLLSEFQQEFTTMYLQDIEDYTQSPTNKRRVAEGTMSAEQYESLHGINSRMVYNMSVNMYGLLKLKDLVKKIFKDEYDELFGERFEKMEKTVYKVSEALARNSTPEFVKALIFMSDMTRLDENNKQYRLNEGEEYSLSEKGGNPVLVLAPRAAFYKYAGYSRTLNLEPLYPSPQAFEQALMDVSMYLGQTAGTERQKSSQALLLGYEELISAGVVPWTGRSKTIPGL